jgi:hypothetical protein
MKALWLPMEILGQKQFFFDMDNAKLSNSK